MAGYMFHPDAPLGLSTCTYAPGGVMCGAPAHIHALLTITPLGAAAFCASHWFLTLPTLRPIDFHAFGDHCNLPNATWIPSTRARRGTCQLPQGLTDEIEQFANQPADALTP